MIELRSLGHACFTLSDGQHTLVFDPYLRGNPQAVCGPEDLKVDCILVSHGHGDHLGDAVEIAKATGAPVVGVAELCRYCGQQGVSTVPGHIGGRLELPFGWVKITPAWHGSAVQTEAGTEYTGLACGFLVNMGGRTVYFAGDTGVFGDMAMIRRWSEIDVAILPIGDTYTMGIEDALIAVELLRPGLCVPMHYNTFDRIQQDPKDFARRAEGMGVRCRVLAPGESASL